MKKIYNTKLSLWIGVYIYVLSSVFFDFSFYRVVISTIVSILFLVFHAFLIYKYEEGKNRKNKFLKEGAALMILEAIGLIVTMVV